MKKIFILIAGILLLSIFSINFVLAATEAIEPNHYDNSIENPQTYIDSIVGKGKIIIDDGANIVNSESGNKGIITTLKTVNGNDEKALPGGDEKVVINLKDLPQGSKILKDGSILINGGKPNEVTISGGTVTKKRDGSFDIDKPSVEANKMKYIKGTDSTEPINLKLDNDKVTLSSKDMVHQTDSDGKATLDFAGSVSVFSDGHLDIEKNTYFSAYRDLGNADRETWRIGDKKTENGIDTFSGVNEKISFSKDINWKPSDNQAYIKYYNDKGVDTLDIGNVNFKLDNLGIFNSFFEDSKTNIITNALEGGEINLNIKEGSGTLFIDNRGVNTMGDVAGVNLNSKYQDSNGETHDFILNEDGTILKCSEPCRECGRAWQFLDSRMAKAGAHLDTEVVKLAYKNDQNQFIFRTTKGEIFIYDVDSKLVGYSDNGKDFKYFSNGKVLPMNSIGSITQQTISSEMAAQKASIEQGKEILPQGTYSITPTINLNQITNLKGWGYEDAKAGDIVAYIGPKTLMTLRLDTETGDYHTITSATNFQRQYSPENLEKELSKWGNNFEVIPYSYNGGTIKDASGKQVGSISNNGDSISISDYNGNKIGTYRTLEDARKAFEGRPWWQFNSRTSNTQSQESVEELLRRYSK